MSTRGGLSISLKMIFTTTLLIVIIVAIFGLIAVLNTRDLYEEEARRQQQFFERSTREHGTSQIETLSEGIMGPLKGSEFEVLHPLLTRAKQHDVRVRHIWLLDSDGRRVASSEKAENDAFNRQWNADHKRVKRFTHELLSDKLRQAVAGAASSGAVQSVIRDHAGERLMVVGKPLVALGTTLGSVYVIYSMRRLAEQQARIQRRKERAFARQWQRTAMIGGVFVLVGLLLAIMQGVRISKPIRLLTNRATQIAQGDLQTRVEVSSGDELGVLAENFNQMADQLTILMEETAQQGAIQKELEVARNIQEALVPSAEVVDLPFLRLAGYFEPASECGGDWWTYHELADGKVLLVIGDVTGHGVPSAMITATAKSAVDTLRAVTSDNLTVTYLLEILNRAILESAQRKFVMTCFASIIDPKDNTITFANAGHNFPYLYREEAGRGKFSVLMTRGNRLGDMADSTYQAKKEEIKPGDLIVWYTDGIVECENEIGEEYGEKRFRNSIRKRAADEPDVVRNSVVSAAAAFFGGMAHKDDITLVVGRYYEPGTAPPLDASAATEGTSDSEGA